MVARLRAAGCVFAEDEARILIDAVTSCAHEASSSGLAPERSNSLLAEFVARRVAGEPLEQIVGWVEFAGQRLHVAPGVFVPRQRTALLAKATMRAVESAGPGARFLEAFCGVGPVATTVSRALPETQIHLGDHDETALERARKNVGPSVNCHRLTCLKGLPQTLLGSFDVISAVPPYVPDAAAEFLPREAIEHEAPTALFGGADGLDLVRCLIRESGEWLAPGGVLLIELGREQRHTAADFAGARGFRASCILGDDEQTTVLELRRPWQAGHTTPTDA
ncbi:methyltransferase [Brevibacterium aurantiacum]|uniref:Methyltransferase n=1 Tax=Brevibacterium aurantiacum TaxID=273384 RepID=A0A556CF42_BREAU|nr:methyltransferase [Brevibacterium aurantiacum]